MSENKNRDGHVLEAKHAFTQQLSEVPDRRKFLLQAGAAATVAAGALASPPLASAQSSGSHSSGSTPSRLGSSNPRKVQSFQNRVGAATREAQVGIPTQITNGDETNFPNYIGNYSKGLVHNAIGEVSSSSYQSFLNAVNSGNPALFEQIQMGGTTPLVNPQAGLAFDLEGCDSHQAGDWHAALGGEPGHCGRGGGKLLDGPVPRREFHAIWKRAADPSGHRRAELPAAVSWPETGDPCKTCFAASPRVTCWDRTPRNSFFSRSCLERCPSLS